MTVGVADLLLGGGWVELVHLAIGLVTGFVAFFIFRFSPFLGIALLVAFVAFVLVKEFWWDTAPPGTYCLASWCTEGASVDAGAVDSFNYFLGGVVGFVSGLVVLR